MTRGRSLAAALATLLAGFPVLAQAPAPEKTVSVVKEPAYGVALAGEARGRSGRLRAVLATPLDTVDLPLEWAGAPPPGISYRWLPVLGTEEPDLLGESPYRGVLLAPDRAGVWELQLNGSGWSQKIGEVRLLTLAAALVSEGGFLNGYFVGSFPAGGPSGAEYRAPVALVEITPANQDLLISDRVRLGDLKTKDQHRVWPKYVALDLRLIDKLELMLDELGAMGIRARHFSILSGYRTPQYNGPGGDGRAAFSRHMYGDAADVFVDNDGDGWMDDLNGDGRADAADARLILLALERVVRRYPTLEGGAGVYDTRPPLRGPFLHVDVRGERSRW